MIDYVQNKLKNGLEVIVHQDKTTPLVAVNILYKVGSRNEQSHRTGFAHLFEHLMFSGSKHVEDFDTPIQMAGGENNAFTNSDTTNFYNLLPKENLETALWLESDRMAHLNINGTSLEIQKKVVVEEFKEVCLNQPYGDMWHRMSRLAYQTHPYQWPTIGKDFSHIEDASLQEVQSFFEQFYCPSNAILTITGNIDIDKCFSLVEQYFGWIPRGEKVQSIFGLEPKQTAVREEWIKADVPSHAIYMGFHMGSRSEKEYYICDLISDILSNGRSSRFYQNLFKNTNLFTSVDAYISGTIDPGLLVTEAKLRTDDIEHAEQLMWDEFEKLKNETISDETLSKLINKIESATVYGEVSILNKAMNLAYFAYLGDCSMINDQVEQYQSIRKEEIQETAQRILTKENCSKVVYQSI